MMLLRPSKEQSWTWNFGLNFPRQSATSTNASNPIPAIPIVLHALCVSISGRRCMIGRLLGVREKELDDADRSAGVAGPIDHESANATEGL
jgi:hypothetical protein